REHLLEEAHETLEAIDGLDPDEPAPAQLDHLEEELGDLLFQVMIHSVLAAETGAFDLSDVARGIHDKLWARHPHVFGDAVVESDAELVRNWEHLKRQEKQRDSILDGIPVALPALQRAAKVLRKGARVGLDAPDPPTILGGLQVELSALRDPDTLDEERLGELLLSVVALAATADIDPEVALRTATGRLADHVRSVEGGATA
ncbi:MAG: MazG nucleotide pyrophosphohydrolase domain-containing protein, partial [Actinomycetota bacterium]